jgi:WhiB family transcriptional regulator, redox-sensing transcriptional regulator
VVNDYVNPEDWRESVAAGLDRLADVPTDMLWTVVTRDGACMALVPGGPDWPEFTGQPVTDRELAARICAGCPVRDACLELEFRTAGADGLGVWGALNEGDRRAVYPLWLARRAGDGPDGGER